MAQTRSTAFINGIDFAEYGVRVLAGGQHDALPETRDRTITIPGRHGAYDYGADLGPRQFELKCGLIDAIDPADLQVKIRKLVNELTDAYGRPKTVRLTFSEEPDKYYAVRYTGRVGVDRIHRLGFFSIPFTAFDPMARSVVTSDQIIMGSDTPIMSDFMWGTGLSERVIKYPQTFTIINNGSTAIRFSFNVTGSGEGVKISANGRTFTLGTFADKTIDVNGVNYTVKVDGVTDLTGTSGDFVELMPGVNDVTVEGWALDMTISESLVYEYI
jgi:predicted phage tail component-like protein